MSEMSKIGKGILKMTSDTRVINNGIGCCYTLV